MPPPARADDLDFVNFAIQVHPSNVSGRGNPCDALAGSNRALAKRVHLDGDVIDPDLRILAGRYAMLAGRISHDK